MNEWMNEWMNESINQFYNIFGIIGKVWKITINSPDFRENKTRRKINEDVKIQLFKYILNLTMI